MGACSLQRTLRERLTAPRHPPRSIRTNALFRRGAPVVGNAKRALAFLDTPSRAPKFL